MASAGESSAVCGGASSPSSPPCRAGVVVVVVVAVAAPVIVAVGVCRPVEVGAERRGVLPVVVSRSRCDCRVIRWLSLCVVVDFLVSSKTNGGCF